MFNSTENMTVMPQDFVASWVPILDNVQLAVAIIGIFSNLATLLTFSVSGEDFPNIIRMLLQYQSAIDFLCCLEACLLFNLPQMWAVGNEIFDTLVCHTWHTQVLYWFSMVLSVYNLITLAIDRYMCICHPLRYNSLTKVPFAGIIGGTVLIAAVTVSPGFFLVRMRDGLCRYEYAFGGPEIFDVYGYMNFILVHAVPTAVLCILYSVVMISFYKRVKMNIGAFGSASVIDKATTELTKTTIFVTVFFIASTGLSSWYFLMGSAKILEYTLNSPIQKIGVLLSLSNSVVNPFIYASFMPMYRRSVKKTFLAGVGYLVYIVLRLSG